MQQEFQQKAENKSQQNGAPVSQAKLLELVITMDHSRIGQALEKTSMLPVTKFTYLRELLGDRVRKTIDSLLDRRL